MQHDQIVDPWTQAVHLLAAITQGSETPCIGDGHTPHIMPLLSATTGTRHEVSLSVKTVTVKLVERLSERALTVDWRDATLCCYVEQPWSIGVARRRGLCALSGSAIKNGDRIFSPRMGRQMPTNSGAMILASAVDAAMPVRVPEHA